MTSRVDAGRTTVRPTGRGLGVAAAGVLALVAAAGFGTPALAPVGVGFLAAVIAAVVLAGLGAGRVRVTRTVPTRRPRAGEPVEIRVAVHGRGGGRVALAGLEWDVDAGAAGIGAEARTQTGADGLRILVPRARRGEHHLPPVRIVVADPFGLAVARRAFGAGHTLLVVPRTVAATADASALGDRTGARRAAAGEDIANLDGLRQYREGDPLSRVHWGQSAKRGRLHTKVFASDEGAGRVAAVVLDLDPDGERADGELAVSAAASLARAAAGDGPAGRARGRSIGLWTGEGAAAACDWSEAEVRLARAEPTGGAGLAEGLRLAGRGVAPGAGLVAVTSRVPLGAGEAARALRRTGVEVVMVLVGAAAAGAPGLETTGVPVVRIPDEAHLAAALAGPVTRTVRARA